MRMFYAVKIFIVHLILMKYVNFISQFKIVALKVQNVYLGPVVLRIPLEERLPGPFLVGPNMSNPYAEKHSFGTITGNHVANPMADWKPNFAELLELGTIGLSD